MSLHSALVELQSLLAVSNVHFMGGGGGGGGELQLQLLDCSKDRLQKKFSKENICRCKVHSWSSNLFLQATNVHLSGTIKKI